MGCGHAEPAKLRTCLLYTSFFTEKQIPYACFHFTMDGREYDDDLGKSIAIEDFYQHIKNGSMPVTSQVNAEQYEAMFEPILREGKDIIHLTLSSGISGTINSAQIARDELAERYPDRRITVVDSLAASSGYGLLVDTAWEKMMSGYSYDELCRWLDVYRLHLHHWFFTSDLSHLRRGGRISASAAFFGGMLNILSLIHIFQKLAALLQVSPESIGKKLSAGWVKEDSFVPIKTIEKLTDLEQLADPVTEETQQKIALRDALLLSLIHI